MVKNKKQAGSLKAATPPRHSEADAQPASREAVSHLSIAEAMKLLHKNGCGTLTAAELKRQIASGAPANPDGTIDLIHYAAWLCDCLKSK